MLCRAGNFVKPELTMPMHLISVANHSSAVHAVRHNLALRSSQRRLSMKWPLRIRLAGANQAKGLRFIGGPRPDFVLN